MANIILRVSHSLKILNIVLLATQVQPKGVKKKRGLTPHEQHLEDLDIVVQWHCEGE
jgi:hypothetical protein